ncbi:copper resistance protein CopC [Agromyces sp. MMS24-JH15]|uniref:copper resistance CopC family protein n=1 Tax=Agromyces sp. MMS24-JH15 TaxID=3243765 RepID=UPI003747DFBD
MRGHGRPTRGRASRTRRAPAVLAAYFAAVGAAAVLALAPAVPAFAHNSITGTTPAADSTIVEQPGAVVVSTSDALLEVGGGNLIDLTGPDGLHYASACAEVSGTEVSVPVELGPAGEYTVVWRVVSADGHPISGEYAFTWAPASGAGTGVGMVDPACDAVAATDATSGPEDAEAPDDAGAAGSATDVAWIASAVVIALAAGVATWLVVRRRGGPDADDAGAEATDNAGAEATDESGTDDVDRSGPEVGGGR